MGGLDRKVEKKAAKSPPQYLNVRRSAAPGNSKSYPLLSFNTANGRPACLLLGSPSSPFRQHGRSGPPLTPGCSPNLDPTWAVILAQPCEVLEDFARPCQGERIVQN